jgi:hypothetical protein
MDGSLGGFLSVIFLGKSGGEDEHGSEANQGHREDE